MPSCGLMIAAMTVKIAARSGRSRQSSRSAEQEEDDAERVDLAPDDAVEPGDRVDDHDRGTEQRQPLAPTELADHRPDEVADREVGEDRRDLDQVADAAQGSPDRARRATGRTGSRACSRGRSRARRSRGGPSVARSVAQNRNESRSASNPEPGRRYAMMRRRASPSARTIRIAPAVPASRSTETALPCLARAHRMRGQSPGERLLHERGRWIGA